MSERFYEILEQIGVEDTYEDIDYDSLNPEFRELVDKLNLAGILEEQIDEDEPDLPLLKFLLRRLGQLGGLDAVDLIFKNFKKFVPVIRETIEYVLRIDALAQL